MSTVSGLRREQESLRRQLRREEDRYRNLKSEYDSRVKTLREDYEGRVKTLREDYEGRLRRLAGNRPAAKNRRGNRARNEAKFDGYQLFKNKIQPQRFESCVKCKQAKLRAFYKWKAQEAEREIDEYKRYYRLHGGGRGRSSAGVIPWLKKFAARF